MTPRWLVPDGSRLSMEEQDGFWFTAAMDGGWETGPFVWRAELLVMGVPRPVSDRVAAILLHRPDSECDLLWKSGVVIPLSDCMPGAFVRHGLRSGIHLHWRDDQDETIQRELVPLTVI